jgi:hypothetical protein
LVGNCLLSGCYDISRSLCVVYEYLEFVREAAAKDFKITHYTSADE